MGLVNHPIKLRTSHLQPPSPRLTHLNLQEHVPRCLSVLLQPLLDLAMAPHSLSLGHHLSINPYKPRFYGSPHSPPSHRFLP